MQQLHNALHDIGTRCKTGAGTSAQRQLTQDVDIILAFARRHPDARFPIDDETARSLSVLIAVREDLRGCAPRLSAQVNRGLPPQYRAPA